MGKINQIIFKVSIDFLNQFAIIYLLKRNNLNENIMKTVLIQEYATSQVETRTMPLQHARNLGVNGGFYKVQILGEFDQVEYEYK